MISKKTSDYLIEAHGRIIKALMALIVPILGAGVLLAGKFRRSGFVFRITVAVVIMVAINSLTGITENWVQNRPWLWLCLYIPPVIAALLSMFILMLATTHWRPLAFGFGRQDRNLI